MNQPCNESLWAKAVIGQGDPSPFMQMYPSGNPQGEKLFPRL